MITIEREGICVGCPFADIAFHGGQTKTGVKTFRVHCNHESACRRAHKLGKSEREEDGRNEC